MLDTCGKILCYLQGIANGFFKKKILSHRLLERNEYFDSCVSLFSSIYCSVYSRGIYPINHDGLLDSVLFFLQKTKMTCGVLLVMYGP